MKNYKQQRGSAMLAMVGVLSVAGIMALSINAGMEKSNQQSVGSEVDMDVITYVDKAMSLASYFITNNLVLCRDTNEGKWENDLSNTKCIWGGSKYSLDASGKTVALEFYGLTKKTSNDLMVLEVPRGHDLVANKKDISMEISFDIKDFNQQTGDRNLASVVGELKQRRLDRDYKVVQINIKAYKDNLKTVFSDFSTREVAGEKSALIRRPLAIPILKVSDPPLCNLTCTPGSSHNPYKECRSVQEPPISDTVSGENGVKASGEGHMTLTITNDGPGAIYALKFIKSVDFDDRLFPDTEDIEESVDIMSSGADILMPGKSITYQDTIPCIPPTVRRRTVVRNVSSSAAAGTSVTRSIHKEKFLDLNYNFDLENPHSDIVPRRLFEQPISEDVDITRDVTTVTTTVNVFSGGGGGGGSDSH